MTLLLLPLLELEAPRLEVAEFVEAFEEAPDVVEPVASVEPELEPEQLAQVHPAACWLADAFEEAAVDEV